MCKGTGDGSTASNFSDAATGYIDIVDEGQACSGHISKMKYDTRGFRYPIACDGSETTYYADYKVTNHISTAAFVGGNWTLGRLCGMSYANLAYAPSTYDSNHGSSPSCQSKEELSSDAIQTVNPYLTKKITQITQADYNALPSATQSANVYLITD